MEVRFARGASDNRRPYRNACSKEAFDHLAWAMTSFLFNYGLLLLGLAILVSVVLSLATGSLLTKYGNVSRSKSSALFWALVVGRVVGGVGLIVWQLYLWKSA